MDEEDVLLGNALCDIGSLSEVDEAAVLGDDVVPEASTRKDLIEEKEELDYDEDLEEETERTPRSSKFASERIDHRRQSMRSADGSPEHERLERHRKSSGSRSAVGRESEEATTVASQMPPPTKLMRSGRKVLMNPHYRGAINTQSDLLNWGTLKPMNVAPLGVQLRPCLPAIPQVAMPPQPYLAVPSSSADFSKPPPLVPISNFTTPPPTYHMGYPAAPQPAVLPTVDDWSKKVNGFLDKIAAPNRSSRRYSHSQSRSSSSSSRSRSRSYSSRSSSFSDSSRSSRSSRRNSRTRGRRSSSRRSGSRHLRRRSRSRSRYGDYGRNLLDKRSSRFDERKGQERRKGYYQDPNHQEKTIECAKAIGLDNDYLSKLEEQKKMREELLRKKEERRFQNVQRMGTNENISDEKDGKLYAGAFITRRNDSAIERLQHSSSGDSKKSERRFQRGRSSNNKVVLRIEEKNGAKDINSSDTMRNTYKSSSSDGKMIPQINSRKSIEAGSQSSNGGIRPSASEHDIRRTQLAHIKTSDQNAQSSVVRPLTSGSEKVGRKKAYLAVVIGTANKKSPDVERMKLIASTVGPLKKVWASSEECVSVIFESHDSAKQFMFKYNGKIINGLVLRVTLQKVFVNLAEL